MARIAPAFQFYAEDFFCGCIGMTDQEVGIYAKLLSLCWFKDGVDTKSCYAATADGNREIVDAILKEKFTFSLVSGTISGCLNRRKRTSLAAKLEAKAVANAKQTPKQNPSKRISKAPSKTTSKSQSKNTPSLSSPTPLPKESLSLSQDPRQINFPLGLGTDTFRAAWIRWCDWYQATNGRELPWSRSC